jgi:hypothetical protein
VGTSQSRAPALHPSHEPALATLKRIACLGPELRQAVNRNTRVNQPSHDGSEQSQELPFVIPRFNDNDDY